MNVVKIPQTDVIATAPGCFDLPQAQAIDLCDACGGSGEINHHTLSAKCGKCDGNGYIGVRLVTSWRFTQEEWDYLAGLPLEERGVYMSVCAVHTPPVNLNVQNPFEIWPDLVPLKQYYSNKFNSQNHG